MANYGMLRNYRFSDSAEDIRGSKLYGVDDEKLGKIDDVIFDHTTGLIRYIVVDTGGWLTTKKFLVPADRLRASTEHQDDFTVDLNKEQIESFPPYSETDLESDEQWADYEGRYSANWKNDPVQHRESTDRNITPGPLQTPVALSSPRVAATNPTDGADMEEIEDTEFIEPGYAAGTSTVEISNSANGIGPRWDTFQDRLRERRKEVIGSGSTTSESADYRKAS